MKFIPTVLLIVAASLLAGCYSIQSISGNAEYPTGYRKGAVYVLKKPIQGEIIRVTFFGASKINAVDLLDAHEFAQRKTSSHYEFTEVPSGTKIVVKDVLREWSFEVGTQIKINAEFVSGTFEGVLAGVEFVSTSKHVEEGGGPGYWLLIRDPNYLEEEPNQSPAPVLRR